MEGEGDTKKEKKGKIKADKAGSREGNRRRGQIKRNRVMYSGRTLQ